MSPAVGPKGPVRRVRAGRVIPVLVVTGPIGVGNSAVLYEADSLLIAAGSRHATVELEELGRCWFPAIERARAAFVYRNLAALWANFAAAGADRLLLSALAERQTDVEGELDGARWWARHFEEQRREDLVVETGGDARAAALAYLDAASSRRLGRRPRPRATIRRGSC